MAKAEYEARRETEECINRWVVKESNMLVRIDEQVMLSRSQAVQLRSGRKLLRTTFLSRVGRVGPGPQPQTLNLAAIAYPHYNALTFLTEA
jgi:hypothetical protein